jgi:hypothetical protein
MALLMIDARCQHEEELPGRATGASESEEMAIPN